MTKYVHIYQELLSELNTDIYQEGGAFPSENDVAARFNVSRMTARRALGELESNGYLNRIPGKGNTVKRPHFHQGFFAVKSFHAYAQSVGASPSTTVLASDIREVPEAGRSKLGVSQAIFVQRLRALDGVVVMEEQRYLHETLCAGLLTEDLGRESIHDLLIYRYNLPLTQVWQQLSAITLSQDQAEQLETEVGAAAFVLERVTYTLDQPVTWVHYLMRGDLYRFENTFVPSLPTPQGAR